MKKKTICILCTLLFGIFMSPTFGKESEIKKPNFGGIVLRLPEHANAEEMGQNANAMDYVFSDNGRFFTASPTQVVCRKRFSKLSIQ